MDAASECAIFFSLIVVLLAASLQHMMPSPPVTAVGIDLGTTFSCIASFNDGEVDVIVNAEGSTITPSVLFVPQNGSQLVIGEFARSSAARQPGTLLYDAKRFIGKHYDSERLRHDMVGLPFDVVPRAVTEDEKLVLKPYLLAQRDGGQPIMFAPEDVGSHIVRHLKAAAEARIGQSIKLAVLAVPVGFSRQQIEATRRAATLAGLEVMRMIHEPTAAAMAYGLHEAGGNGGSYTVMVYDMGGGTLDVSLLNLNNGIFEVIAAAGDNRLGGQDFSLAMLNLIIAKASSAFGIPEVAIRADVEAMRALREDAERIKVEMNDECDCSARFAVERIEVGDIVKRNCQGLFYDGDVGATVQLELPSSLKAQSTLTFTRAEYENDDATRSLLARALEPVQQVLSRTALNIDQVDELVLVGGSTRMAKIRSLLREHFGGKEPNCAVSPEEAVAHGTAIQAAILTDRKRISVGATEASLHAHLADDLQR